MEWTLIFFAITGGVQQSTTTPGFKTADLCMGGARAHYEAWKDTTDPFTRTAHNHSPACLQIDGLKLIGFKRGMEMTECHPVMIAVSARCVPSGK